MEAEQSKFTFKDTSATQKVFALNKRIRAVAGGTSASKTISILVWLIDYGQTHKNQLMSVISESYPHLEKGAMLDFENIMKAQGYWKEERWHQTKHTYTFETGTKLEFFSADTYGKAHGPRRDILFLNECNNLSWLIVDQLIIRTRKIVWMDWNPSMTFWFYEEMQGKRDDIDFITLTYKDNEALDEVTIQEIEAHKNNKSWWQVYGLGQLGVVEGRIFSGWQIIEEMPFEARLESFGLDFGYTNDPTAIVAIYYYNGGYILDEILFAKGMLNGQIATTLVNQKKAIVIADSAEPKSIDELRTYSLNVQPCVKGPGSVMQRIQMAQSVQLSVTSRSVNLIKEYRNYLFKTDQDGRITNEPDHLWSHSMDAFMYGLSAVVPMVKRREMIAMAPKYADTRKRVNPAR